MNIFRGNIRPGDFGSITSMEFEILLSLAGGDRHGYAIIQDIGERSGGTLTVRPGTLYRAISRLLEAGLIEEVERSGTGMTDGRRAPGEYRRRYYAMTRAGRQAATIESQRLARQLETARARKLLKTKA